MKKRWAALTACAFAAALWCVSMHPLGGAALAQQDEQAAGAGLSGAPPVELGTDLSVLPLGMRAENGVVTVEAAGVYAFTGTLDGGQIVVDAGSKAEVTLVLSGVSIYNETEPAILVKKARLTTILLAEGSDNRVLSGAAAALDGSAIDAEAEGGAISARADLTIAGDGALFVGGYLNNGIHTSKNLAFSGGEIEIEAVNNGVKGKDSVTVCGGSLTVRAGGDGVISDDESGEGYGVILVTGGVLDIQSAEDAVQAETALEVTGGEITAVAGGGSESAPAHQNDGWGFGNAGGFGGRAGRGDGMGGRGMGDGMQGRGARGGAMPDGAPQEELPEGGMPGGGFPNDGFPGGDFPGAPAAEQSEATGETSSAKGLKAGTVLRICGGKITVDAADDALHANGSIEITGGSLTLASGDDGVHADDSLTIDGGEVRVTASYEGLEANQIAISGGTIDVTATDDGINANGGSVSWGWRGPASWDAQEDEELPNLLISGGTVYVNAEGDGLDSNGNILVKGGLIVVDGPSRSGNGALDAGTESGGTCEVHGGTVLAIGSRGMAETFGDRSTQVSFEYSFNQSVPAGSALTVAAADGAVLFEHTAAKEFASVVFSCPALAQGDMLTLTAGDQRAEVTLEAIASRSANGRGWR